MTRPSLIHDGFLIPNAADVSNPRMAEPDRIDFNIIAHALWGVLNGCGVTVSGSTAIVAPGLALVNGEMVVVAGASISIPTSQAQDRFDLIVVDQGGAALLVGGASSLDPVFPDPGLGVTVLAAVFAPTGLADLSSNVIDKRKFVSKALLTKIDAALPLIQNLNGSGDHFKITGGGTITWEGDTTLSRTAPATLTVHSNLIVENTLTVGGTITAPAFTAGGRVQGSNLMIGPTSPVSADPGTLYQNDVTGKHYIRLSGTWNELATVNGTVPVGTIITSIEAKAAMVARGWVPLDGGTISEATYPNLFALAALAGYISGSPGSRTMVLPNAEGRVLVTTWAGAGAFGGPASNMRTLSVDNMPRHKHSVTQAPAGAGVFNVRVLTSGLHSHAMVAGGTHQHGSIVAPTGNIIDSGPTYIAPGGLFAAPYGTTLAAWVATATGSAHSHAITDGGTHDHQAVTDPLPDHQHAVTEQEVGLGTAFDVTPAFLAVFTYIRS